MAFKTEDFKDLPAVLSKKELRQYTEKKDGVLDIYVNRWLKQGVLRKAGERCGMYYNISKDPAWQNHVLEAVAKKFPSAMLAGPSVLHATGLQTQIPGSFHVVVLERRSFPDMDMVTFMPRNRTWFAENIPEHTYFGMRSLSPSQALKDGLMHQHIQGSWVPDLDDIELDEELEGFDVEKYAEKRVKTKKKTWSV